MNLKKRKVFLFGAGAMMDWGGSSTNSLTGLVRKSGFKINGSDMTITEFIYQQLLIDGYNKGEVNFETIINVIEEMIVFHSEYNSEKRTPSIPAVFFKENYSDKIFNFSIKGGVRKHGYELQIPRCHDYIFTQQALNNENPKAFFLQHLLVYLLSDIAKTISEYSYNSPDFSKIDKNTENSILFTKWFKNQHKNDILRLYTLNYDYLFKVILEDKTTFFNGFRNNEELNIQKITTDFNCNVHYNLHGSIYWKIKMSALNKNNYEVLYSDYPQLAMNDNFPIIQIEKGKLILVSNIITGYQKAQKSMITPFKQMQSSFDKDCMFADEIFIIGYSFGDTHINMSIKTALKYNKNLQLHFIDPSYKDNDASNEGYKLLQERIYYIFPELFENSFTSKPIDTNTTSYFNDKLIVSSLKFSEFLKNETSY